jgi:hypothetical protein
MKKLLLSSVILFIFSISLTIFQISCSKQTNAQTSPNNPQQLNKILYAQQINATFTEEIWMANYDGTNQHIIPVAFPPNFHIDTTIPSKAVRLSRDGSTIFFLGFYNNFTQNGSSIYACNIDGTKLRLVIQANLNLMRLEGVY